MIRFKLTAVALAVACIFIAAGCGKSDPVRTVPPAKVEKTKKEKRRSVCFYMIDTLRADRTSMHGHERKTTPFLDFLARKSVVFENCYTQASWTMPSVASILTSRYPSETGMRMFFQRLDSSFHTLPEMLKQAGWFTKGFSTNPLVGLFSNLSQGFKEFVESTRINRGDCIGKASGSAKLLNQHIFPWLDAHDHWPMLLFAFSVDPEILKRLRGLGYLK